MSDINIIIGAPQNISVILKNETEFVVRTNEQGPQGVPGITGSPGPTGGTGPRAYTHEQSTALSTWTITHNLGFRPAGVQVFDYQGNNYSLFPIDHIDINSLTLSFGYALSGFSYLS